MSSSVIIKPGGNWPLKRWPGEKWARLSDRLNEYYKGKIVITGATKDVRLAEDIASLMKTSSIIAAGKTSLKELGALCKEAELFISNDSGPLHIALSQKVKVIALFGPTSAQITGPYGQGKYAIIQKDVGCTIPCYNLACGDNRCMKAITIEDVLKAVDNMLHK